MLEASIRALLERVFKIVGETPRVGRWHDDSIASVLHIDTKAAMDISREIEGRLSGLYSIQDNGITLVVQLDVTAGIIDRALGCDEPSFQNTLLHISEALGAVSRSPPGELEFYRRRAPILQSP